MKPGVQGFHRRSIRLRGFDYSQPGGYFVTIVTQGRACLFGEIAEGEMRYSPAGKIAGDCWCNIPDHFANVELGTFVIMPNHVHGIILLHDRSDADASERRGTIYRAPTGVDGAPTGDDAPDGVDDGPAERFQKPVPGSIPTIVRTYKAAVTREIVRKLCGAPTVWQRNYYEHIIRGHREHNQIHLYIECNIDNWGTDDENPVYLRG